MKIKFCDNSGKMQVNTNFEVVSFYENSLNGMQSRFSRRFHLNGFSYYDSEKKICKLCYESVHPIKHKGGYLLINDLDGKPHRVRVGLSKSFYCKMAKVDK